MNLDVKADKEYIAQSRETLRNGGLCAAGIENMFKAVKESNYVEKIIDSQNRLSYTYKIQTTQGLREFKIATGSNGYIVSFIPNWP